MKYKTIIIISLVVLVIIYILVRIVILSNYKSDITYMELSDPQLVEMKDDYYFFDVSRNSGGYDTGITGNLADVDRDAEKFKASKFTGIYTLQATKMERGNSIQFQCIKKIEDGNAKIYIVSPSNEILKVFESDGEIYKIDNADGGIYLIRVVGDECKCEIGVVRNINK